MARQYIKVFFDWGEATAELTYEEKGRLIDAMIAYAQGQPFEMEGNERFVFPAFRLQINRDAEAYEATISRNRENGSKGGRPKKNPENPVGFSETQPNPENPVGFSETQKSQDKDKDKDKDKDEEEDNIYTASAAGDDRPDFNTIEAYASSNLTTLSPGNMQELGSFKADLSEKLIRYAIDESCAAGKRSWAYVRKILYRYVEDGIKTIGEAKQRPQQPKQPTTAIKWG